MLSNSNRLKSLSLIHLSATLEAGIVVKSGLWSFELPKSYKSRFINYTKSLVVSPKWTLIQDNKIL